MVITFDPAKRDWTLQVRGLDFADAEQVFAGPVHTVVDRRFDYGEERCITLGLLRKPPLGDRTVVIVWTPRDGTRRIISMRYADAKERALHARFAGSRDGQAS